VFNSWNNAPQLLNIMKQRHPPQPTPQTWQRFIDIGQAAEGCLPPVIEESWLRCRSLGVDPHAGRSGRRLDDGRLERLLKTKADLIRVAEPFMENLYEFVTGSGFVAVLFDERGILLEAMGDPDDMRTAHLVNFEPGADWTEGEIGTNGAGTALALGRPVQITGYEHFCRKHHAWTCSGAPILDEAGRTTGFLDLSGPIDRAHQHTLGMVVAAAQAIQNAFGIQRRNRELAALNGHLSSVLRSASNGIIVLDEQGAVQQVNLAVERAFGLKAETAAGMDFPSLIRPRGPLLVLLESGTEFQDQELELILHGRPVPCLASGRPVLGPEGRWRGAVISIHPIQRIRQLVNHFGGSQAVFRFEDIRGDGEAMRRALDQARDAALGEGHILLQGESGTGKEMFAQAIHNHSGRARGPFVAVNCGAIPRELLASELFGYQDGAFTGARKGGRPGKFELASGGTLFLDEIGDMPMDQQVALLRVLQDRTLTRLGGDRPVRLDVRIICATNKDLRAETRRGAFREDLFYRLHVDPIRLPALREHLEDVPQLLRSFLAKCGAAPAPPVEPGVLEALCAYGWPGNVREFQNVAERLVRAAKGGPIRIEHLGEEFQAAPEPGPSLPAEPGPPAGGRALLREALDQQARTEILEALRASRGNVSRAAGRLGIARNTLYRKMDRLGLS
jgi:PAS domain S-box-containing protein